jgi:hypothetical protein
MNPWQANATILTYACDSFPGSASDALYRVSTFGIFSVEEVMLGIAVSSNPRGASD